MGVGDLLTQEISIPASGSTVFQPAVGVEYIVFAMNNNDATNVANCIKTANTQIIVSDVDYNRYGISNSMYLIFTNGATAVRYAIIMGIQTKGSSAYIDGKVLRDKELMEYRMKQLNELKDNIGKQKIKASFKDGNVRELTMSDVKPVYDSIGTLVAMIIEYR